MDATLSLSLIQPKNILTYIYSEQSTRLLQADMTSINAVCMYVGMYS